MYGNDINEIIEGMNKARSETRKGRSVVVIMNTHMGFGVDFMLDNHAWHGVPPNNEQAEKALAQLEKTLGDY
jgi:transketolase